MLRDRERFWDNSTLKNISCGVPNANKEKLGGMKCKGGKVDELVKE